MKITCSICKKKGFNGYKAYYIDGVVRSYCPSHASDAPIQRGYRGIYDRNGNPKDREWLNHKLWMTRSDRNWEKDIKSRKIVGNGTVIRDSK